MTLSTRTSTLARWLDRWTLWAMNPGTELTHPASWLPRGGDGASPDAPAHLRGHGR